MKRLHILFVVFFVVLSLNANAQAFQWARQFSSYYALGFGIITDNNSNVISTGEFRDSIDLDPGVGSHWEYKFNGTISSTSNYYLSKVDASGAFVWGHVYNSSNFMRVHAIEVDGQNNIIVYGQFRDSINLDFGTTGFWLYDSVYGQTWDNIFVAKYDPAGNLLWGQHFNSSSTVNNALNLWGHGLKVDGNDNILISGMFRDTVDFDPGIAVHNLVGDNNGSNSVTDKFLLKLDSNGSFIWVRQWKQNSYNAATPSYSSTHDIDVDANNNIFIPILFNDSLDVDPGWAIAMVHTQGFQDISFLKLSSSGNLIWHKEIGGISMESCYSIATDAVGNLFCSIQSNSNTIDMDPGIGNYMVTSQNVLTQRIILKLDNSGNFIWAKRNFDNQVTSTVVTTSMATDTSGGVYLISRIYGTPAFNWLYDLDPGPGALIVKSMGLDDIAFQNFSGNGDFVWGGIMGGTGADFGRAITTDNGIGVYLTGDFRQKADFNPTLDTAFMTSSALQNAFIVKLNNCNKVTYEILQACDSVIYNSQVFYSDTIFQYHYPAANACDSAHAVVIDVKIETNDTLVVQKCNQYVWNSTLYTSNGMYTANFGLPAGCDSIVTIDLTIKYDTLIAIDLVSCDTAIVNGIAYYQSGQYQQLYTNTHGCDSNYIINFTRLTVDTSISFSGVNSLIALANNAVYQWIDCNTMQLMVGDTTAFFTASQTGLYACIVTQNGCTDTSSCYNLTVWPNRVNNHSLSSRLYPNPSAGSYQLELDKNYKDVSLEIRTISGQLIWQKNYAELKETNLEIEVAPGVYMLYILQGDTKQVKKLLKW